MKITVTGSLGYVSTPVIQELIKKDIRLPSSAATLRNRQLLKHWAPKPPSAQWKTLIF
ncbi:MAG: hypothetical protein WKG06_09120 [Segetibacter sp.]